MVSTIHSIDFREGYKKADATRWLKKNNIKPIKTN